MASPADKETEEFENTDQADQQNQEESSTSEPDQDNKGSSDPEKKSEDEPSTFEAIKEALKPEGEDEDESSSEEDEKSEKSEDDKKSDDEEDVSDDDFEDFSPEERAKLKKATAERFDKLKGLYRESKEKVEELSGQLEQSSVEAGYYRQFVGYLDENRISQDEANQLFHIGAMMKNDPNQALQLMTPYYNELLQLTGNVLPSDLQQQVQRGLITRELALEQSRLRASGQANQAIQDEKERYQQQLDSDHQRKNIAVMQSAIGDWEKQWSASDPDYTKKKDRVLDRVELLLVRAQKEDKLPQTVEEAVALANQAKSEIEADLKQFKPRKKVSTVDGGSNASSLPEPKDTSDVIRRALNN